MFTNIFCMTYICTVMLTCTQEAIVPLVEEYVDFKEPIIKSPLPTPTLGTTKATRNVTWKLTVNDHNYLDTDHARSSTEGIDVVTLKEPKDVNDVHLSFISEKAVTTQRNEPLGNSETPEPRSITSNMKESSIASSDLIALNKPSDSFTSSILSDSDNSMITVTEHFESARNETPKIFEFSETDSYSKNESETTSAAFPEYTQLFELDSSHIQTNSESEESENNFFDRIEEFMVNLDETFNFHSELIDQDASTETSRVEATTNPITSHQHSVVTKVKEIDTEFPVNAESTERMNSESEVFSAKAREHSSGKHGTTSMAIAHRDLIIFESKENDLDNSNVVESTFATTPAEALVNSNVESENATGIKNEMEFVTTSGDLTTSRPDCPPSGMCVFWFMAQDTCAADSHCLGPRICCKVRCSKTCIDV